jgi:hypothetical protein
MPNDVPKLVIELPCKVSTLESKIRAYCEQNGCFDTAVATVNILQTIESYDYITYLEIYIPKKDNAQ